MTISCSFAIREATVAYFVLLHRNFASSGETSFLRKLLLNDKEYIVAFAKSFFHTSIDKANTNAIIDFLKGFHLKLWLCERTVASYSANGPMKEVLTFFDVIDRLDELPEKTLLYMEEFFGKIKTSLCLE